MCPLPEPGPLCRLPFPAPNAQRPGQGDRILRDMASPSRTENGVLVCLLHGLLELLASYKEEEDDDTPETRINANCILRNFERRALL